ncbi:lactose transport system [Vibrio ishigakensis]|uniref:Lactose transport system n=1 Tax=Vibrio ishigakensis TaxID=1481914 RepID=A0A0B8NJU9_9VIBR|nr:extracellular solute-binding protein [Vibrio ishigakensis]GAM54391.1 lactose transport system [Vibrio ishigakensis]
MKKQMVRGMVAAAVSAACLGNVAFAGELKVWAWDPHFNVAIMEKAASEFEANNEGVDIQVIDYAKADIEQKLHTMLASRVTSELPDIVLIEDYNAQKYLQSYPGSFEKLTGKVDHSQFAPYKVNLMTMGSDVYGVPFDSGVTGLYYRTDILEKAGFKAEDLQNITWDRFIEIGKVVKEKTGISFAVYDPSDMGLVRVMLQSAGSWYFNEDGSLNIEGNKALEKALSTYAELFTSGITRPNSGWSEWVGAINSGRAATITTGVWITGSVKAANDQQGKWAVAPTPRLDIEGSKNASNLGGSSWYVLSSSKNKDEAIKFLKDTYTNNPAFYDEILVERGAVGSYAASKDSKGYQQPQEYFGGQEVFAEFSEWMQEIPSVNYGMYTYEVDAALAAQLPAIMQGAPVSALLTNVEQELKYSIAY